MADLQLERCGPIDIWHAVSEAGHAFLGSDSRNVEPAGGKSAKLEQAALAAGLTIEELDQ